MRGTKWLTEDTCAGTLVKVARGIVTVEDLITHKTLLVRAGHSFTASPTSAPAHPGKIQFSYAGPFSGGFLNAEGPVSLQEQVGGEPVIYLDVEGGKAPYSWSFGEGRQSYSGLKVNTSRESAPGQGDAVAIEGVLPYVEPFTIPLEVHDHYGDVGKLAIELHV